MNLERTVVIPAGSDLEKDAILTIQSLTSYMAKNQIPKGTNPIESLDIEEMVALPFYRKIVPAAPALMQYILESDLSTDDLAQALDYAYKHHVLVGTKDNKRIFLELLKQDLAQPSASVGARAAVGAYLTVLLNDLISSNNVISTTPTVVEEPKDDKKKDAKKKEDKVVEAAPVASTNKPAIDEVTMNAISETISYLLGNTASYIQSEYPTLSDREALAVAAALSMANGYTVESLIELKLPITAKIFEVLDSAGQDKIIKSALYLNKEDFIKVTPVQQQFIDSLKQWVYGKLNGLVGGGCFGYLIHVYGSAKPQGLNTKLIYIKDCGTAYPNLLQTARQLES